MLSGMIQIGVKDIVQILILYLAVYFTLRYVRRTRSAQMLLGGGVIIVLLLVVTYLLNFDALSHVIYFLLGYMAIILIVVFQPELRRILSLLASKTLFPKAVVQQAHIPEELNQCIQILASKQIGALIAVERGISLAGYEDTGHKLDSLISQELLVSILTPPLPLHDGGIIIRGGRIAAAHCLFPVSNQISLKTSGMRHRAAVGLSEETDAVVVAVSEESGIVSVAYNGKLRRYPDEQSEKRVLRWLRFAMPGMRARPKTFSEWLSVTFAQQWQSANVRDAEEGKDAIE